MVAAVTHRARGHVVVSRAEGPVTGRLRLATGPGDPA